MHNSGFIVSTQYLSSHLFIMDAIHSSCDFQFVIIAWTTWWMNISSGLWQSLKGTRRSSFSPFLRTSGGFMDACTTQNPLPLVEVIIKATKALGERWKIRKDRHVREFKYAGWRGGGGERWSKAKKPLAKPHPPKDVMWRATNWGEKCYILASLETRLCSHHRHTVLFWYRKVFKVPWCLVS